MTVITLAEGFSTILQRLLGNPHPPTPQQVEDARRFVERGEELQRIRQARISWPANVELAEKLAQAGLPGNVSEVAGK